MASKDALMAAWAKIVQMLYPDWKKRTYCVPPVYMKKMSLSKQEVAGQKVFVVAAALREAPSRTAKSLSPPEPSQISSKQPPQSMWSSSASSADTPLPVFSSETREDFAQQHVLHCLQELGEVGDGGPEPMFVLSQLKFENYLGKLGQEVAELFPRPANLLDKKRRRGDFDTLVLHRRYGVLIGEIKSVGLNPAYSKLDEDVLNRVIKSVSQLRKSWEVLQHILSDFPNPPRVKQTLMLPYVKRCQLLNVLQTCLDQTKDFCDILDAANSAEAAALCLCADDLSDPDSPWDVSQDVVNKLQSWWRKIMADTEDQNMSDDVYLHLLARFCGPATTVSVNCVLPPRVELRTEGEAASELGWRLAYFVLTPVQLDLLQRAPRAVCLVGPPGTGKSLVLVVRGLISVRDEGLFVVVLSTNPYSFAVCKLIFEQLQETLKKDTAVLIDRVRLLEFDLYHHPHSVDDVLARLEEVPGKFCILMDEANFCERTVGPATQRLVEELTKRFKGRCSLWAACLKELDIPRELTVERLTAPLRCAPSVCREVAKGIENIPHVSNYSSAGMQSPGDGLRVRQLHHRGVGHSSTWPVDCFACGKEIAAILADLRVGVPGQDTEYKAPAPLQYRDVFVLTRSADLHETTKNKNGEITRQASGVVCGLRSQGIPVGVLGWRHDDEEMWRRQLDDLAVARTDQVTVARWRAVDGLERKIVVYLPGRDPTVDQEESDESVEADDRLRLFSRCTTQLVIVNVGEASSPAPKSVAVEK